MGSNQPEILTSVITYLLQIFSSVGVVVSMLALTAVDRGFEARSGQTKDY